MSVRGIEGTALKGDEITPHRESSPESVTEEVSDVEVFESGVEAS